MIGSRLTCCVLFFTSSVALAEAPAVSVSRLRSALVQPRGVTGLDTRRVKQGLFLRRWKGLDKKLEHKLEALVARDAPPGFALHIKELTAVEDAHRVVGYELVTDAGPARSAARTRRIRLLDASGETLDLQKSAYSAGGD